jgi:hypothetical protein
LIQIKHQAGAAGNSSRGAGKLRLGARVSSLAPAREADGN